MTTVPTQIRIDAKLKEQAVSLFDSLSLDMSGAVNIFLRQCVLRGGLPFNVELPNYSKKTIAAMKEAQQISKDPKVQGYSSMEELKKALDED